MKNFTKKEMKILQSLSTPQKIQDFLNSLSYNNNTKGHDTVKSPLAVLRTKSAHCIEGAVFGAFALSLHNHKPLILHLKANRHDLDHVIAPFKKDGYWGALSKTNHVVLRYRDPVYKTIRELVMSYFHEYFIDNGEKTLRSYSTPLNLNIFEENWKYAEQDMWGIDQELDKIRHYTIVPEKIIPHLRKADVLERRVGKILEYPSRKKRKQV